MPIREKQFPVRFTARGLADALDATDKFPGACLQLANLIFDPANPEIMVSRPGVTSLYTFGDFTTPGVVSVQTTIGDKVYGLVASGRNANKDEPFCYDHAAGAFIAVANVTNGNSPSTQSSSGAWTPPTMAMVGTNLYVTHPGFPGSGTMFGWFDLTNPAAPVWNAGDCVTNGLPGVPVSVANFNNRAYFAYGNATYYTDVLSRTRTNASQSLTVGDGASITAQSGLPIQTTSSGMIGALTVFKDNQCWQVTGDGSTLALNYLSLTIGTSAPRSVAQSPLGLYFASSDGPYVIDQLGILKPLTNSLHEMAPDIVVPYQQMSVPSRVAAAYSAGIYRICMQTTINGVQVTNDYWFDEKRRRWTGPHTFSYDCASQHADHFILVSNANPANLMHSQKFQTGTSTYSDLGTAITCTLQSASFPKNPDMEVRQVVESTMELGSQQGPASYSLSALDETQNVLQPCTIPIAAIGTLWGAANWRAFNWASSINLPTIYTAPWPAPLVFKKMALLIAVTASGPVALGTFFARYQNAGYTNVRGVNA